MRVVSPGGAPVHYFWHSRRWRKLLISFQLILRRFASERLLYIVSWKSVPVWASPV